jgi:hypothetical protein
MQAALRRIVVSALLASLWLLPVDLHAQSPQLARIDIFDAGIYCAETVEKVADANAPSGFRNIVTNVRLLRRTSDVPAQLGIRFGLRYTVVGTPSGASVDLRLVTRIPPPGLKDQKTGRTILTNDYAMGANLGTNGYREYHLEYDWEIVPGVWAFELWSGDKKRAEQTFTLYKPQPGERVLNPCGATVAGLNLPTRVKRK